MDDSEITLRLRWRQTWPDRDDDYAAIVDGHDGPVCRIFRTAAPGDGAWCWAMVAEAYDISRAGTTSGFERSPRRAARAAEAAWFAAIRGTAREHSVMVPPAVNAYAAAKGMV